MAHSGLLPVFVNKVLLEPFVYGCFCAIMAELSSYDRDCVTCKAKNICYLTFYRDSLLNHGLAKRKSLRKAEP